MFQSFLSDSFFFLVFDQSRKFFYPQWRPHLSSLDLKVPANVVLIWEWDIFASVGSARQVKGFQIAGGNKAKSRPHAASEIYFAGPLFHLSGLTWARVQFTGILPFLLFTLLWGDGGVGGGVEFFLRSEYQSNSGARLSSAALKYSNIIKRPQFYAKTKCRKWKTLTQWDGRSLRETAGCKSHDRTTQHTTHCQPGMDRRQGAGPSVAFFCTTHFLLRREYCEQPNFQAHWQFLARFIVSFYHSHWTAKKLNVKSVFFDQIWSLSHFQMEKYKHFVL